MLPGVCFIRSRLLGLQQPFKFSQEEVHVAFAVLLFELLWLPWPLALECALGIVLRIMLQATEAPYPRQSYLSKWACAQ